MSLPRWPCSVVTLLCLYVAALAAPLAAPYAPDTQHRDASFAPPTRIHAFAPGRWTPAWPFVLEDGAPRPTPIRFLVSTTSEGLNGATTRRTRLVGVEAPARLFLLGTDRYGRDRLSRLLAGARLSLFGGVLAASLAAGFGLVLGGFAGARGGLADRAIMRAADLFLAVPWLYLLVALRAALPLTLAPTRTLLILAGVIGVAGWARPATLVRSVVLGGRTRPYVEAARSLGASEWFVLRRHILPQALIVVVTQVAILAPQFTLAEITLSFFGLGVSEPLASWGTLLAEVARDHLLQPTWYAVTPLVAVIAVFILYQRAADAVIARSAQVST